MQALVNSSVPPQVLLELAHFAEVIPFQTEGITFPELSGHADLFVCRALKTIIAAPNLPQQILQRLSQSNPILRGDTLVDEQLSSLGAYNVAVGDSFVIANPNLIDPIVGEQLSHLTMIPTRQGLCRCGAICLGDAVLTSDGGIAKACKNAGVEHLLVDSDSIVLPGYRCGCIGGCCGVDNDTLYLIGSLRYHPQGSQIAMFLKEHSFQLVELYDGPLFDAGSILFF